MAAKTVAIQIAIRNATDAIRTLKSLGADGEAALDKITAAAPRAAAAVGQIDQGLGRLKSGNHSTVFQQLGYQVGDFAVQVQSGQSAVTAFVQQGTQLAGAFGPAGAVLGAFGAVAIGVAGYLTSTGVEASTAASELDKLREGTQSYKDLLEQILPLQKAYLEGLVSQQAQAKAAAERQSELNDKLQNQLPIFTGGKLKEPTYDELVNQTSPLLPRGGQSPSEEARQRLVRGRAAEDRAIDQFIHRNLTATVSGDQARPGYETTDAYREETAAAGRAAAAAKVAADAKQRQAEAGKNLIASMELEADSAEKLAAATGVSTVARQKAQVEIDKEKSILQAAKTVHGEELEHYKELADRVAAAQLKMIDLNNAQRTLNQSPAALRNQAERESLTKLDDYNREQVAEQERTRLDAARQSANDLHKILLQPWLDSAAEVSQITSGMFDEFLEKGTISTGKFASGASETFRKSLSGLAGNLVTQPLNQAVATLGQSLTESLKPGGSIGGAFKQFYNDNPVLASAGLGFAAGTAVDLVRGKETYAGLGGAIGAGVGAAAGTYFGPAGTIAGGAIGGAVGTGIGSLFSSGGGLGNDRSFQSYVTKSGKIEYSDKSYSEGNRQITSGVLGQVGSLQESLAGLGATFKNIVLEVTAGNKSGYQLNGKKYGSEEDLTQAALRRLLSASSGLTASQQTVAKNTKARSAQEVLSDLDFAKTFDLLASGAGDLVQAMRGLNEQFDAAEKRADKLGLSTKELARAQSVAAADTVAGQIDSVLNPLKSALGPFGISQGYVAPQATVSGGLDLFRENLAKARTGDGDALSSIVGLGQSTLQAARSYGASGSSFADIFKEVNKGLLEVQAAIEEKRAAVFKDIAAAANETVDQLEAMRKQNDNLFNQLELVRQDLRLARERRA